MKQQMNKNFLSRRLGLRAMLVIMLLLGIAQQGHAFHIQGGNITYTCINACTTRAELRKYMPCVCTIGPFQFLQWTAITPGCPLPVAIGGISPQLTIEVTPVCPLSYTLCVAPGAPINGLAEYYWFQDFNICVGQACEYNLSWGECCRNVQVQSIASPATVGTYVVENYFNNALATCNNAARFPDGPIRYIAAGQDHDLSLHAFDPDGDSLAYSLGSCYGSLTTPVTYLPGFSALQPLGPSWTVSLDPQTGMIHLDANPGNVIWAIICITVREYRNGQLVGSSQLDFDIEAFNFSNTAPTTTALTNVTGVSSAVGDDLYLCSAGPVCFDVGTADVDAGQNLSLFWDQNLPGATFVSTLNASIHDTVTGTSALPPSARFCWTPPGYGTYFVKMRVTDDGCPLWWHADRVVTIHVGAAAGLSTATVNLGNCPLSNFSANFAASGCGPGPFTYTWSGAGGLSGSSQALTYSYAAPGSYPWQVIVTDGGLVHDTIRDTVVIVGQIPFQSLITGNVGLDSCAGIFTNTLGAGAYVSYLWSVGSPAPLITVTAPDVYAVTVQDPSGCYFQDTATVAWNPVDITGIVRTSLGTYLQNQKIYLIRHDTTQQALYAIDSTFTDIFGYYQFCNVTDTLVFLKAAPDSLAYPHEMPTYANLTLFWNNAITFYPLVQTPFAHNFATIFGSNPGGPGFIGGLITQGANKMSAVGDPVPGLRIFLRNATTGAMLGYTDTDLNGYFSFPDIPLGDYEIVPDKPLVSTTNVPLVSLTAQVPVQDSLDFQLHRYWLELVNTTVAMPSPLPGLSFTASPNPFDKSTYISLHLPADADVRLDVYDVVGKCVAHLAAGSLAADQYRYTIGDDLRAGIYFVRLKVNGNERVIKVLKSN
jgi:hypothetical protein